MASREAVVAALRAALQPLFRAYAFKIDDRASFTPAVHVLFHNVPMGASDLDYFNAKKQIKISIEGWKTTKDVAEKLKVRQFQQRGVKFRGRSGKPSAVVNAVIKWFKSNESALKGA